MERKGLRARERSSRPIAREEIVPAVSGLVAGRIFDFVSKPDWTNMQRNKSVLSIYDGLWENPGVETNEAYAILTEDLRRFTPDRSLLENRTLLREWLFKLTIGVYFTFFNIVRVRHGFDVGLVGEAADNRYSQEIKTQINALKNTLSHLEIDDLALYIGYEDMFHFHKVSGLFEGSMSEVTESILGDSTFTRTQTEELRTKFEEQDRFRKSVIDEDRRTWERLSRGWGGKQIEEVLSLLPIIREPVVTAHLVAALEENLIDSSEKSELSIGKELNIDPKCIVTLLNNRWVEFFGEDKEYFDDYRRKLYGNLFATLESNLELANFSVPKKHLPTTAIMLLSQILQDGGKEKVSGLLSDVNGLVMEDKKASTAWVIALLALRGKSPEMVEIVDNIIVELSGALPEAVRQILLEEGSGKIWLRPDGRLRVTDTKTNLPSLFPVFTSSKAEREVLVNDLQEVEKVKEPKTEHTKKPQASEVLLMPFLGEIGRVDDKDVRDLIFRILQNAESLDDGRLLDEFGQLAEEWQNRGIKTRELLYLSQLNSSDSHFERARKYGFEGLYIKGEDFVFVLSQDVASTDVLDKTIQVGLQGKLDTNGQLLIAGLDNSFIGEKEHLFLNNLALHCVTQPFLYISGIVADSDRDTIREINKAASFWNRFSSRGTLPRIERTKDNPYIVMRIDGYKEPVLIGEK